MSTPAPTKAVKRSFGSEEFNIDSCHANSKCPKVHSAHKPISNTSAPTNMDDADKSRRWDVIFSVHNYFSVEDLATWKSESEVVDAMLTYGKDLLHSVKQILKPSANLCNKAGEKESFVELSDTEEGEKKEIQVISSPEWILSMPSSKVVTDSDQGVNNSDCEIINKDLCLSDTTPGSRTRQSARNAKKLSACKNFRVMDDISDGKEKIKIPAINRVDDEKPPSLIYKAKMDYPKRFRLTIPAGCNCIGGCSDSKKCCCVKRNGGEIPFNEKGAILSTMHLVHECGPRCKCPPTCLNRVSQHGIRFPLELFKTKSKGWGVRSREYIPRGSFICEYVGELLDDKEADKRVGSDEYLFDITVFEDGENEEEEEEIDDDGGFSIDGAICSNVGRYINHSCDPNVYTQEVLYDHDDKRMPHIMFFAFKAIHPMQELAYDYGYKNVRDENGNIKRKDCFCGALKCKGRMY